MLPEILPPNSNRIPDGTPYRLQLSDTGSSLALRGPTGRTELVETLAHVWTAADRICSSPIDPLDEHLLEQLET
jgi:hypothetical protein